MHLFFAVLSFLADSILTFFIMRVKSAPERGVEDGLKARLGDA